MSNQNSTPNVSGDTAVSRLYGSWIELHAILDSLDFADRDVWADARGSAWSALSIRTLWSDEHPHIATAAEERALIDLAHSPEWSTTREDARERLTVASIGAIKRLVRNYKFAPDWHEDAQQTALLGLWEAVAAFDPAKGHRRLAATIVHRVQDTLRALYGGTYSLHVPTADRAAYSKTRAAAAELVQDTHEGELNEVAARLAPEFGLTAESYWYIYHAEHALGVAPDGSVTAGLDSGDIDATSRDYAAQPLVSAILPEIPTPNVESEALVVALLGRLDARERQVVALRFGLDENATHTEDEAAAALSLTPRRVRQIQAAALAKLRDN